MSEDTVCLSVECIYKDTCKLWLENHIELHEESDSLTYPVEWYEWKRDRCHVPTDGRIL